MTYEWVRLLTTADVVTDNDISEDIAGVYIGGTTHTIFLRDGTDDRTVLHEVAHSILHRYNKPSVICEWEAEVLSLALLRITGLYSFGDSIRSRRYIWKLVRRRPHTITWPILLWLVFLQ